MLVKLPKIFKPKFFSKLERIGNLNDGGYVISSLSIKNSKYLVSLGIYDDWSFERDFLNRNKNCKLYAYDNYPTNSFFFKYYAKKLVYFFFDLNLKSFFSKLDIIFFYYFFFNKTKKIHIKKLVVPNKFLNLNNNFDNKLIKFNDIFKGLGKKKIFLKIDIEGNEYRLLDDIIRSNIDFEGIVIEFHNCDLMFKNIEAFIKKINLDLIHVHVNNYGQIYRSNFPAVIELSFSKKKYNQPLRKKVNYPLKFLDSPNDKLKKDFNINFI